MISLPQLRAKALGYYEKMLRAHLAGAAFFPLPIPTSKTLDRTRGSEHIHAQQEPLLLHSKNKTGRGYTLSFKPNARTRQSEISRIEFETRADYLAFLGKTAEFALFEANLARTAAALPELLPLPALPRLLLEHAADWPDLLTVGQYFQRQPQPRQYVRNLPLALPTKFIERHQTALRPLLNWLIPEHIRQEEDDFFRRFHLYVEEPSLKIRFLDESLRLHPAVSQCSVWVSEFEQLQLAGRRVYIIENLTTFLSFPLVEDSLAIWGGGFAVSLLSGAEWLHQKQLFYWGDIDVHGFQILAQIRAHFPALQSLLMDYATFSAYHQGERGGNFTAHKLSNLTDEEHTLYQLVIQTNARLEQEKLPAQHVAAAIQQTALR